MSDKKNKNKKEKLTPDREAELAEALDRYTDPTHPEYDPEFDKEIRTLRPDWFEDEATKRARIVAQIREADPEQTEHLDDEQITRVYEVACHAIKRGWIRP